ncbi:hypothetical protein Pla22_48540 [Rubripirellula amarantea]|uniref:Condensation domain protein n=1 Tax=Rubripirellula amarantea TaxID=2527999 RepID=A0A5C5WFM5_9BACT|nr:hypothetical protein [Rubripirellula amarantea]TWT49656.1 hypothetical protein Pla22_48540 [Rubripirellula amarantea]
MPDSVAELISAKNSEVTSTVVERYFARPCHGSGMVFDGAVSVEGEIDLERLTQSWHLVVQFQPRLFARLSGKGTKQKWNLRPFSADEWKIEIANGSAYNRDQLIASIAPRQGIAGRLVIHQVETSECVSRLHFFFHHSAIDGVGAIRIVTAVLRQYQSESLGSPTKRIANDADTDETSKQSDRPSDSNANAAVKRRLISLPNPRNAWVTIRGHNAMLDRHSHDRLPSLESDHLQRSLVESHGPFVRTTLGQHTSSRLRQHLRRKSVTLNDFSVAITLKALSQIISPRWGRYLCVMNPVQTRTWKQRRETNNHVGFAFVRRRHEELESVDHCVEGVQKQLTYVREHGIAHELADGMKILESIPLGFPTVEKLRWFLPTASVTCLSNLKFGRRLGLESRTSDLSPHDQKKTHFIGNAKLKDIEFLAPMQSNGQLAITIWETSDSVSLSWRHVGTVAAAERCLALASLWTSLVDEQISK